MATVAAAQVCIPDNAANIANTYFPGLSTTSNSVTVGGARTGVGAGSTAISAGDLVFIIQMQDASINTSDTDAYGDGVAGGVASGRTSQVSSGLYEFRRVASTAAGVITMTQALANAYTNAAASPTRGQRRFQVLRVPEFSSLTLSGGAFQPPAWNGTTGGIFVLDVAGPLAMTNYLIDVTGRGFRGGGGVATQVISGSLVTSYAVVQNNAGGATGSNTNGAPKGEGTAGTPQFVAATAGTAPVNGMVTSDLGASGYPAGLDFARGAPSNAGGGGTQHNSGGGGGANGNVGGKGGGSFAFYSATDTGGCVALSPTAPSTVTFFGCNGDGARQMGGFGGAANPATATTLFLGGGGGAGDTNNADDNPTVAQAGGGNGGGAVFIRANSISATNSQIAANGANGLPGGRDAAGAGGAGGSIYISTAAGSIAGLSLAVNGGNGGSTGLPLRGNETQGPGGGGGAGIIGLSTGTTVGSQSGLGGAPGVNNPVAGAFSLFGATSGGNLATGPIVNSAPDACLGPALTLTKTAAPSPFTVGQAGSYTLTLTNTGSAATTAVSTIVDTIPTGLTIGALPANCTAAAQVVTCTVAAGLAATTGTVSFVIPVTPTAAAGASVTNAATVRGGGDPGCAAATNPLPARCNPSVTTTINNVDMTSAFSGLPLAAAPGATVNGSLTCVNGSATVAATSATCTVTGATLGICQINGAGSAVAQPATVPAGGSLVCAITMIAPSTGIISLTGTTSASNELNTTNNGSAASVPVIDAVNDAAVTVTSTTSSQTVPGSVLASDTIGGVVATTSNVSVQPTITVTGGTTTTGWSIDTAGVVTAPANVAAGSYSVNYTICSNPAASPVACDSATKLVTVNAGTPPDLTPTFTFSFTSYNVNDVRDVIININEINNVATSGLVRFFVPFSSGFTYTFNPARTTASLFAPGDTSGMQNGNWTVTTQATGFLFASTTPIPPGARSRIVITSQADVAGTKANITVNIVALSGGEVRTNNNAVVLAQSVQR